MNNNLGFPSLLSCLTRPPRSEPPGRPTLEELEIELGFREGCANGVLVLGNGYTICITCHDQLASPQAPWVKPCLRCCAISAWKEFKSELEDTDQDAQWLSKMYPRSSYWWDS